MDVSREGLGGRVPEREWGGVVAWCGGVGVVQPNVGVKRRGANTYLVKYIDPCRSFISSSAQASALKTAKEKLQYNLDHPDHPAGRKPSENFLLAPIGLGFSIHFRKCPAWTSVAPHVMSVMLAVLGSALLFVLVGRVIILSFKQRTLNFGRTNREAGFVSIPSAVGNYKEILRLGKELQEIKKVLMRRDKRVKTSKPPYIPPPYVWDGAISSTRAVPHILLYNPWM